MDDKFWAYLFLGIALFAFLFLLILTFKYPSDTRYEYIYECTDFNGNVIYCTHAYKSKYGGMYGYKEDGTQVMITSYKEIKREK